MSSNGASSSAGTTGRDVAAALACELDPDIALAAALASDLERNFEALVLAYRDRVVSFVTRLLHDEERAQDVAQDAFVRAYRALQTYDAERRRGLRLRSWLFAIAHNLTRNAVRDAPPANERLERADGSSHAALRDAAPGPESVTVQRETLRALDDAVKTLSPRLRPAFVLRYLEDLPYDEVAQVLAQPVGTVKASAHRGLLAVRAHLENDRA